MAVDNPKFGKGIALAGGFDLGAKAPLDSRETVATIEERDLHVTNNRAYAGMLVFVEENQKTYQCILDGEGNFAWEEFGFNEEKFQEGIQSILDKDNEQDGRLDVLEGMVGLGEEGKGLDAMQDAIDANTAAIEKLNGGEDVEGSVAKAVKDAVDPVQADLDVAEGKIDALEAKVGQDVDGDNPATGLFLEVDEAKAAADKAQGEVDALEERVAAIEAEQDVQDGKIDANEKAIGVLNGGADVEGSVAKAVADEADLRVKGDEALQDNLDQAIVDLQAEIDNDVKAEKERAEAKEAELLEAINKEVGNREAAVQAEQEARENADNALDGRIAVLEADAPVKQAAIEAAQAAADKAQGEVDAVELKMDAAEGRLDNIEAKDVAQDARLDALEAANDGLEPRVKANEDAIAKLNGGEDVEGSVAKAIKDAIDPVQEDIDEINGVIGQAADGENAATGLHKIIADGDAQALANAKAYADQQITALVDSAPDAMNTLNELAEAIKDNKEIYDAWVVQHEDAMAKLKVDLQAEIDTDVKAEADRAAAKEAELQQAIDDEEARALAQEAAIRGELAQVKVDLQAEIDNDVKAEKERAEAKEAELLADVEAAQAAADKAQGEVDAVELRVDALEAKVGQDVDGDNPATGLFLEVDEAKAAADKAQGEVDALEERMDVAEGEIDVLQAFVEGHDHSVMEQGIADNKAAIDILNGGVDVQGSVAKSIADVIADYSTTEQMKAILGSVVNSLALSMEDNKILLKLGGVEGITIHETSLDMATDEDIDAIIADLDAE